MDFVANPTLKVRTAAAAALRSFAAAASFCRHCAATGAAEAMGGGLLGAGGGRGADGLPNRLEPRGVWAADISRWDPPDILPVAPITDQGPTVQDTTDQGPIRGRSQTDLGPSDQGPITDQGLTVQARHNYGPRSNRSRPK